jgi:hypothetical protein
MGLLLHYVAQGAGLELRSCFMALILQTGAPNIWYVGASSHGSKPITVRQT